MSEIQLGQALYQEQEMLMELHPFMQICGIEVLENMREVTRGRESDLEGRYKKIRQKILTPPLDKVTVIGALSRTGGSKSSLLQGFYRLLTRDSFLRDNFDKHGVEFEVCTLPFSLSAEVTKSPELQAEHPEYAVPPERSHGTYSDEEYARISDFMWYLAESHVLERQGTGRGAVLLVEPSSMTAVPEAADGGIVTVGIDRGLSPLYRLASDAETKDQVDIFALDRDPKVAEEVVVFRENAVEDGQRPAFFDALSDITIIYTEIDESGQVDSEDAEVADLAASAQQRVRQYLPKTMAPPQAQERSDREFDELKESIVHRYGYRSRTDRRFFRHVQEVLQLPASQFHYITNPHFQGRKTLDLDYFLRSLPSQFHRGLKTHKV